MEKLEVNGWLLVDGLGLAAVNDCYRRLLRYYVGTSKPRYMCIHVCRELWFPRADLYTYVGAHDVCGVHLCTYTMLPTSYI